MVLVGKTSGRLKPLLLHSLGLYLFIIFKQEDGTRWNSAVVDQDSVCLSGQEPLVGSNASCLVTHHFMDTYEMCIRRPVLHQSTHTGERAAQPSDISPARQGIYVGKKLVSWRRQHLNWCQRGVIAPWKPKRWGGSENTFSSETLAAHISSPARKKI